MFLKKHFKQFTVVKCYGNVQCWGNFKNELYPIVSLSRDHFNICVEISSINNKNLFFVSFYYNAALTIRIFECKNRRYKNPAR